MDSNHDTGGRPGQPHWTEEPKPGVFAPVKQQYDDALHMMEVQGGSFVKALAHLYCMADPVNKAIARQAFAKYFDSYGERFKQHRAALSGTQGDGA